MMKHNVLSGILLMLQEWEEWQLHNRAVLMYRKTSEACRKGLAGILWNATHVTHGAWITSFTSTGRGILTASWQTVSYGVSIPRDIKSQSQWGPEHWTPGGPVWAGQDRLSEVLSISAILWLHESQLILFLLLLVHSPKTLKFQHSS